MAAHRLDERAHDEEADPHPAGARRVRRARLPELLEAARQLVAAHADAEVGDADAHRPAVGGRGHHHRPVGRRVGGGVGEEVVDDDPHRDGVGEAGGEAGGDLEQHPAVGAAAERVDPLGEQGAELERAARDQLGPAGTDPAVGGGR